MKPAHAACPLPVGIKFGKEKRTPAMQAGIVDRKLTFRQIFSTVLPPRQHTVQNFRDGSGRIEWRWS